MAFSESPRGFLLVWALSAFFFQAVAGYWSSVITTVEQIYHLSSFQSGFLSSFQPLITLFASLPLVYFGRSVHRPRFLFVVTILTATGTFLHLIPHLLSRPSFDELLIGIDDDGEKVYETCSRNRTDVTPSNGCDDVDGSSSGPDVVFFWLILGKIFSAGYCAVYPISVVYIDEGLEKRSTVLYIGMITSIYAVGFAGGYIIGAACLMVPLTPFAVPEGVDAGELPGAWWLGYLVISIIMLMTAIPYLLFPAVLPPPEESTEEKISLIIREDTEATSAGRGDIGVDTGEEFETVGIPKTGEVDLCGSIKRFLETMGTIISNPVVILLGVSGGVLFFGTEANAVFSLLFVEEYFILPPEFVSIIAGLNCFISFVAGQLAGAYFIRRQNLTRLQCAIFSLCGIVLFCIGSTLLIFVRCPDEGNNVIHGYVDVNHSQAYLSDCSVSCGCSDVFEPVCAFGETYTSPCLAGWQGTAYSNDVQVFYNCSCVVADPAISSTGESQAILGPCGEECSHWILYGVIQIFSSFMLSAASNAPIVIILRSVRKIEQELTFSFMHIMFQVIGMIPGPIVFGWIIDQACILTSVQSCPGGGKNCLFYDRMKLRYLFSGTISAVFWLSSIGSALLVWVIWRRDGRKEKLSSDAD